MTAAAEAAPEAAALSSAEVKLAANLALASRMLSMDGHDDLNQGQVSARLPGQDRFLIKGALVGFNEAMPAHMILASVDDRERPHPLAPPELPLHQAIYAARADVNAIVHSHAPCTLVFGATDLELKAVSHDGACFDGRLARFTLTSHTVLEIDTGRAIAASLGQGSAALLRNHGGVIVGKTLRQAAVLAQVLERACRLQLLAQSAGVPYHVATAEDIRRKQDYIYSDSSLKAYWDYCVRLVKRSDAEAAEW
ncbi:MAG: class II aldolase family protein [Acidobacteria bacterium]|nr:MAG: class II aldolase family protein [Acidobacteriota bacterium]